MKLLNYVLGLAVTVALTACGGGGGNPGTPTGGTTTGNGAGGTTTPVSADPQLAGSLFDAAGAATNAIGASGYTVLNVTLKDPSGLAIPNQVIDVSGDATKIVFPEGNAGLTNSAGVATIKLARASLVASGAGSLTVTFSYKAGSITTYPSGSIPPTTDKVISTYIGYQLSAANITLTNMNAGASTLAAYGTRQVTVQANIDGAAASTTPVQVNFMATCGQVSPATASTNSNGIAVVSYTATDATGASSSSLGCSGKTIEISASTIGASAVSKSLIITAAPATNLSFVSVSPSMIFLDNSGGATQAIAEFKLVNARGEPLLGQDISLTLKTQVAGAVKASIGNVGNTGAVTATTDVNGRVAVPIFSGTVPTSVVVNAALVSSPLVQTDSAILTIASGRAAQNRVSLSMKALAIEGFDLDGVTTDVTLSLGDRQGNPVPDGTAVNFVTEGGVMIPPVCYTGGVKDPLTGLFSKPGNSQCSVTIRSQEPRPANGRVSILAYVAGEEDFVDKNFNNVYDAGDTFTDLGNAFRDDNENLTFNAGEFSVPRTGAVTTGNDCPGLLGRPGTCDGVWGAADVRKQGVIVFASGNALVSGTFQTAINSVRSGLDIVVKDINNNSMPVATAIAVTVVDRSTVTSSCQLVGETDFVVANSLSPTLITVGLNNCVAGDIIKVKVTSPNKVETVKDLLIPTDPLITTAGTSVTLGVGQQQLYQVAGGIAPYSYSSSDVTVATADHGLLGSFDTLYINAKKVGTANITVADAVGSTSVIAVTVK